MATGRDALKTTISMNELDKMSQDTDDLNLESAAVAADVTIDASSTIENAGCDNVCAETSSPAADLSVAADAAGQADVAACAEETSPSLDIAATADKASADGEEAGGACALESSPALDISEAADTLSEDKEETVNYHAMSKQEMIEALARIIASGDLEAHKEVAAIKQAYYTRINRDATDQMAAFVEQGNPVEDFSVKPEETEPEMKRLLAEFRERRAAYLEEKEEERRRNLEEKNRIIGELRAIADDIDNINLHFTQFQQLQQDFKNVGEVPAGADNDVWKNYQAAVEQFYDRLKMNKELRDLDFKKNLVVKQELVAKAKELTSLPDPIEAFRKLQELHDRWREAGPVAKEVREEIWNEFKEASTEINRRHQDYFTAKKAEEADNEARKTAVCEKAEAVDIASLKTFAEWDAKTQEIIAMQKEFKEIGFAPRKSNGVLFSRFRKVCDDFFAAKAEFFRKTKDEFRENLAKKEALCEKAEALVAKAEEKGTLEQLQELQKEWRTVGVVRRKQGDEVWKRFCAAVDAFHAARKKYFGAQRSQENDNLKAKQAIVAQLKAIPDDVERREVIGKIRDLQGEWQKIGHVPFKHKDSVNAEYRAELDRLFGAFDVRESRQRMKRFEGEVRRMEGDGSRIGRERDRLVRAIEARQAEIKTIENNLGFFKFSSGSSMVREYEKKIDKIKEDIAQIQEKIDLLDAQEKTEA